MGAPGLIGGLLITLFGILNCYFGYAWFRVLLGIWGFFLGGSLGLTLASDAAPILVLVAGLVGAVVGTLLIYFLFRIGVLLIGAVLGYTLTTTLLAALGFGGNVFVYGLAGAAVFGVLALLANRFFVILITAFSGASTIITGVTLMMDGERVIRAFSEREAFNDTPALVGVFWLLLALSGIVIQYRAVREG